ncbi:MAG: hypothetical protein JSS10_03540 [Verrucomicrobia bacterium]|nr:hypothetical protein [Verrucomicrobiota bacterium]
MGPEPLQQKSKIPLKVEEPCSSPILDESEDSQGSREESVEEEEPPLLPPEGKLRISFTPEADL